MQPWDWFNFAVQIAVGVISIFTAALLVVYATLIWKAEREFRHRR